MGDGQVMGDGRGDGDGWISYSCLKSTGRPGSSPKYLRRNSFSDNNPH